MRQNQKRTRETQPERPLYSSQAHPACSPSLSLSFFLASAPSDHPAQPSDPSLGAHPQLQTRPHRQTDQTCLSDWRSRSKGAEKPLGSKGTGPLLGGMTSRDRCERRTSRDLRPRHMKNRESPSLQERILHTQTLWIPVKLRHFGRKKM